MKHGVIRLRGALFLIPHTEHLMAFLDDQTIDREVARHLSQMDDSARNNGLARIEGPCKGVSIILFSEKIEPASGSGSQGGSV